MKPLLQRLFQHQTLTKQEAYDTLVKITEAAYKPEQVASFLTVFRMRSITVDELSGFRAALLDLARKVDLTDYETTDMCGTGGDGKNTFNISTLSAFLVAGAGHKVAKHGNYGVSSVCGSSNVMEHLGYTFSNDEDALKRQLDTAGICFLHAPLFHPAMKEVAPIRRSLGVRTFFNMLGPLVNPSKPQHQIVGVFNLELARLYQYIFQQEGKKSYTILHSLDGYDEVSLTGPVKAVSVDAEQVLQPEDFPLPQLTPESLFGGDSVPEAADIFTTILEGRGTDSQNAVLAANAGLAIKNFRPGDSLESCVAAAKESLASGMALNAFRKLVNG